MAGLLFRHLVYFGPDKDPAIISFEPGLNVICGASDTGKSFIIESIDFMLGQEGPVQDIPERSGYDRVRLAIQSAGFPPLTLDRSIEGGNLCAYEELLSDNSPQTVPIALRCKHSAARHDTLSYTLLARTGLASKALRKNKDGDTRSLSFRDLARLCVVTEQEIMGRGSPLLSTQYVSATAEYATFKLLLTGTDDSALISVGTVSDKREQGVGKIELLSQMIEDLQSELDEQGADEDELTDQLARLEMSIGKQNEALFNVQRTLDGLLTRRGDVAKQLQSRKARLIEIDELLGRFRLLDSHYHTDQSRLEAIHESGSLFIHLEHKPCPLCGALPGDQHQDSNCEGSTEAIVEAADSEMIKIGRLRLELNDTLSFLAHERNELEESISQLVEEYRAYDKELGNVASPTVSAARASYNQLISERAEVRMALEKRNRLSRLVAKRTELEEEDSEDGNASTPTRTQVPKNVLDDYARKIEEILQEWHYPNATRVFFDERKRDLQIAGKERGSTGKGLRAITHAAMKIGLLEFCREHDLPHPGFVVLDSPLLAYWKPEGHEDDLNGTDLKDMFYRYLLGLSKDNQIIIIENQHPPDFVFTEGAVTVFTKNPHQDRYGFFPAV